MDSAGVPPDSSRRSQMRKKPVVGQHTPKGSKLKWPELCQKRESRRDEEGVQGVQDTFSFFGLVCGWAPPFFPREICRRLTACFGEKGASDARSDGLPLRPMPLVHYYRQPVLTAPQQEALIKVFFFQEAALDIDPIRVVCGSCASGLK